MRGGLWERSRSGSGLQEWPDGSKYDGEFETGMKHGSGTFTWANGESHKGSFYKDYRHGSGMYFWPDGSQFTGKFYLNRKEGYGVHLFPDEALFKGLYHADERFGPGVLSYPDGHQDVGLWCRRWLLRLCIVIEGGFTLRDFPDHMARLPLQHTFTQTEPQAFQLPCHKSRSCTKNKLFDSVYAPLLDDPSILEDVQFVLPPGIEIYTTDSDHLPLPDSLRQELDMHFFNRSDSNTSPFFNDLPLQLRMELQVHTHRLEAKDLDWDVAAVLAMKRDQFGPQGPLELESKRLIKEASLGDLQDVQNILRDGRVHPDVTDVRGHCALIAATVNCHNGVIHLLLDSGADVNRLNGEGMSALAVCCVLLYPFQSLYETEAERTPQKITADPEINDLSVPTKSLREEAAKPASESAGGTLDAVLLQTDKQRDHMKQSRSSEEFSGDAEPQTSVHTEGSKTLKKHKEVPQVAQDKKVVALKTQILKEGESQEVGSNGGETVNDYVIDSASIMAGIHIDLTQDIFEDGTNCKMRPSSSGKTQGKYYDMEFLKTELKAYWITMKLLLERGADPNVSNIPMPALFLAIKADHVEAVERLLVCGARTDLCLPEEQKGLYPLHLAAGLLGPASPKITELLLHAVADPDVKALDADEAFELDTTSMKSELDSEHMSSWASSLWFPFYTTYTEPPEEGGRMPLHVACQKLTDHTNARDVVSILLSHNASTNHLWSGHSPLSLAIASGNDLAVDELLAAGADPNLPLSPRLGSALCATVNIDYDWGLQPQNRIKLVEKLIKAGANILMPVLVGEGSKTVVGTIVDFAHYTFNQDWRIAKSPYCPSSQRKRDIYNTRCQILTLLRDQLREAASNMEKKYLEHVRPTEEEVTFHGKRVSLDTESKKSVKKTVAKQRSMSAGQVDTSNLRKPLFKFCYQCGRSAWVKLTFCTRCNVFFCSMMCKSRAWRELNVESVDAPETSRSKRRVRDNQRTTLSFQSARKTKDLRLKLDKVHSSKPDLDTITHIQNLEENYSFI